MTETSDGFDIAERDLQLRGPGDFFGTRQAGVPTFSGNDLVVTLTGVADQQYVTVTLSNVASTDGGTGGSGEARIGFLMGDVNQTRVVSVADVGFVNAQLAQSSTTREK